LIGDGAVDDVAANDFMGEKCIGYFSIHSVWSGNCINIIHALGGLYFIPRYACPRGAKCKCSL